MFGDCGSRIVLAVEFDCIQHCYRLHWSSGAIEYKDSPTQSKSRRATSAYWLGALYWDATLPANFIAEVMSLGVINSSTLTLVAPAAIVIILPALTCVASPSLMHTNSPVEAE